MCSAPTQGRGLEGVDTRRQTVIQGVVTAGGAPVPAAFVRLLDGSGEFTAEVVASATGQFRFFAAPGRWTVRALSRSGTGELALDAPGPGVTEAELVLAG